MSERDELQALVEDARSRRIYWEDGTSSIALGTADDITDAILAAGYRKPRTVTSAAELDELPVGSVVMDRHGDSYQRYGDGWLAVTEPWQSDEVLEFGPATILHEGER